MLIAHSSSTCDVCLENYTEDSSYHSIPCGHIFCLPCLMNTDPPRCPLCRHDFSSYNIRKIHIALPTPRDAQAHTFEKKLLENGPNTPLEESYALYEEIQAWIREDDRDEYLTLRAFAACLCSYYELRDKYASLEESLQIERTSAEETQTELRRSLDEARRLSPENDDDYKTKYRLAELELADIRNDCVALRAQITRFEQQEKEECDRVEALRSQLQSSQTETGTLRTECANLRSQVEKSYRVEQQLQTHINQIERRHRQEKQLLAEHRKFYADYVTQMEQQQQDALAQEEAATSRRKSNPLPSPPKPIDIDTFKRTKLKSLSSKDPDKGKSKDVPEDGPSNYDPMASAYVPTLAASITANASGKKDGSGSDERSEVTTLIFRPPVRIPLIPPKINDQHLIEDADLHLYNQAGPSSAVYQESNTAPLAGPSKVRPETAKMNRSASLHYRVSQPASSRNADYYASTDLEGAVNPRVRMDVAPPFKSRRPPGEIEYQTGRQASFLNERVRRRGLVPDDHANMPTREDPYDGDEPFPMAWDPVFYGECNVAPAYNKSRTRTRHDSYSSHMPPMYYAPVTGYMARPESSHAQDEYYNQRYPHVRPRRRSTGFGVYGYPKEEPRVALGPEDARPDREM